MSSTVAPATIIFGPFDGLRVELAEIPSITCLRDDIATFGPIATQIDRGGLSLKRNQEPWRGFLLSFLHLHGSPKAPAHMPRVAKLAVETTEVTARRSSRARTAVNYASQVTVRGHEELVDPGSESPLTDLESEGDSEPPPQKKRRRKAKVTEPIVYDIPPVETKASTFKGESGVKICART